MNPDSFNYPEPIDRSVVNSILAYGALVYISDMKSRLDGISDN